MASPARDRATTTDPEVVEANRRVHAQLADVYNETEPHFRPENKDKVRRRLEELAASAPSRSRMLDLGCGTGFLLDLAHDLFSSLDGIDATQAMLDRVDLRPGNITLHHGVVEHLPFEDGSFDLVTAYSFLDHLADHVVVLEEAARVLKRGGRLYVDLVPNRAFWHGVFAASKAPRRPFDSIVEREISEIVDHERRMQAEFGIEPVDWRNAEPAKSGGKGFDADTLRLEADSRGFDAETHFEWYLGQAVVMHGTSMEAAGLVDDHLRRLLPVSAPLYKYLVLTGTKR